MRKLLLAAVVLASNVFSAASAETLRLEARGDYISTCTEIEQAISNLSSVHWPHQDLGPNTEYQKDISHWALSSTEQAACSVKPGSPEDVGKILQIVGRNKTPFAVKGAGHAMNPGFSSTKGVQIAMYRFSEVKYHPDNQTADVGSGLIWDEVYAALEPYGVNVVGGRATGVGVAGFTLGGGYSYHTNQYGLTIDTVVGFELVLPEGRVVQVSQDSYPDLFWALKGGFNNFGIVTTFTLKTHLQSQVWGGTITFTQESLEAVNNATVKFSQTVTDPKAAILPTYHFGLGMHKVVLMLFYDYPTVPEGVFDDFLAIPYLKKDIKTRTFTDLIAPTPTTSNLTIDMRRGIFHVVSLEQYTPKIMDAVVNETKFWGQYLSLHTGATGSASASVTYAVSPFLPSLFSHGAANSSAYPPSRATAVLPLNIYYAYPASAAEHDEVVYDAARRSAARLTEVAQGEGQDVARAALYGNYAMFDTPLERIYGANVDGLRAVKARYDPGGVMALAGGFKV